MSVTRSTADGTVTFVSLQVRTSGRIDFEKSGVGQWGHAAATMSAVLVIIVGNMCYIHFSWDGQPWFS